MTKEIEAQIDRLIHDAQRAEAGMEFAARMIQMQPGVKDHRDAYRSLRAKARALRLDADRLCQQHGLNLADIVDDEADQRQAEAEGDAQREGEAHDYEHFIDEMGHDEHGQ